MQVLNIIHVLIAIAMVALVLVQRGAGATAGAAFGSGASGTVFGSRGAGNFLTRSTWILATLFCAISLTMAVVVSRTSATPETDLGVVSEAPAPAAAQPADDSSAIDAGQTDLPALEVSGEPAIDAASEDLPAFDGTTVVPDEETSGASGTSADDS
ncbi:preprotein translocase subunit SecG [Elongatibacter sediminis]|uniref:Protein-export membrane protein SecG n=1 Tax=Elongatibacter sediminis TaxID=3119006 RepID=A0AAW9RGB9_9GAMM